MSVDPERLARGRQVFADVYGSDEMLPPDGAMVANDVMVATAFAEVWSRPGLDIPDRRLLVMGLLAARGEASALQIQFQRALDAGELTVDQLDEVVLQLVTYLGWPTLSMLAAAQYGAIAAHRERGGPTEEAEEA